MLTMAPDPTHPGPELDAHSPARPPSAPPTTAAASAPTPPFGLPRPPADTPTVENAVTTPNGDHPSGPREARPASKARAVALGASVAAFAGIVSALAATNLLHTSEHSSPAANLTTPTTTPTTTPSPPATGSDPDGALQLPKGI